MLFAPDTEDVLQFDAMFVNTVAGASRSGSDELSTPEALDALMRSAGFSGRRDGDAAELTAVLAARAQLRALWTLQRDDMAPAVNELLARTAAAPWLYRHDGLDWHLHATPQQAPLATRILVEAAMALVDVIRTDQTDRLRACDAPGCDGLFVDLSRNGSKRYCSVRCSNRVNMIAHRRRLGG